MREPQVTTQLSIHMSVDPAQPRLRNGKYTTTAFAHHHAFVVDACRTDTIATHTRDRRDRCILMLMGRRFRMVTDTSATGAIAFTTPVRAYSRTHVLRTVEASQLSGPVVGSSRRVAFVITTFVFVWRMFHIYAHDLRANICAETCAKQT